MWKFLGSNPAVLVIFFGSMILAIGTIWWTFKQYQSSQASDAVLKEINDFQVAKGTYCYLQLLPKHNPNNNPMDYGDFFLTTIGKYALTNLNITVIPLSQLKKLPQGVPLKDNQVPKNFSEMYASVTAFERETLLPIFRDSSLPMLRSEKLELVVDFIAGMKVIRQRIIYEYINDQWEHAFEINEEKAQFSKLMFSPNFPDKRKEVFDAQ